MAAPPDGWASPRRGSQPSCTWMMRAGSAPRGTPELSVDRSRECAHLPSRWCTLAGASGWCSRCSRVAVRVIQHHATGNIVEATPDAGRRALPPRFPRPRSRARSQSPVDAILTAHRIGMNGVTRAPPRTWRTSDNAPRYGSQSYVPCCPCDRLLRLGGRELRESSPGSRSAAPRRQEANVEHYKREFAKLVDDSTVAAEAGCLVGTTRGYPNRPRKPTLSTCRVTGG